MFKGRNRAFIRAPEGRTIRCQLSFLPCGGRFSFERSWEGPSYGGFRNKHCRRSETASDFVFDISLRNSESTCIHGNSDEEKRIAHLSPSQDAGPVLHRKYGRNTQRAGVRGKEKAKRTSPIRRIDRLSLIFGMHDERALCRRFAFDGINPLSFVPVRGRVLKGVYE